MPPTVLYSVAAAIPDVRKTVTSEIKEAGDAVYLLGQTRDEPGASEFQRLFGAPGGRAPTVRLEEALPLYYRMMAAHRAGLIRSSHDLSDGGLAVALAEIAFGTGLGLAIDLAPVAESIPGDGAPDAPRRRLAALYSESPSRFVVTVKPEHRARFEEIMGGQALRIGETTAEPRLRVADAGRQLVDCPVAELERAWRKELLA